MGTDAFRQRPGLACRPVAARRQDRGCDPSADLIAAAAAELQADNYLPLALVLGLIVVGVAAFLVSILRAKAPADPKAAPHAMQG